MVSWVKNLIFWIRGKQGDMPELIRRDRIREQALEEKFGRWLPLVTWGPILLIGMAGSACRAWPGPWTFRLLMGSVAVLLLNGIYAWYVVASYEAAEQEDYNGKTL